MAFVAALGLMANLVNSLRKSRLPGASVPELQLEFARKTLERFRIQLHIHGTVTNESPMIFVGNHISYLDIPVLMAAIPSVSFVAKKELASWPVFGLAAKTMNTILVDRENSDSRSAARDAIRQGLKDGRRIVVFPAGTTSLHEDKEWRRGVFEIAQELNMAVQPFRINYSPLRKAAYIDNDFFVSHVFRLGYGKPVSATLEFHAPVRIADATAATQQWRKWAQAGLGPLQKFATQVGRSSSNKKATITVTAAYRTDS